MQIAEFVAVVDTDGVASECAAAALAGIVVAAVVAVEAELSFELPFAFFFVSPNVVPVHIADVVSVVVGMDAVAVVVVVNDTDGISIAVVNAVAVAFE